MKPFYLPFICLFSLLNYTLFSQFSVQKLYNSPSQEMARWIKPIPDGSYAIVGTRGIGSQQKALLLNVDQNGTKLFGKIYISTSGSSEFIQTIASASGIFSAGTIRNSTPKAMCIFTDFSGNIIWQKQYNGLGSSVATGCQVMSNGDFLFYGHVNDRERIFVVRIRLDGTILWSRRYASNISSEKMTVRTVIETSTGDLIISGSTLVGSYTDCAFLKVKSTNGNIITFKTYGGNYNEVYDDIYEVASGDFIVVGHSWSWGSPSTCDGLVAKLDVEGNIKWMKRGSEQGRAHRFFSSASFEGDKIATVSTLNTVFQDAPTTNFFLFDSEGGLLKDSDLDLNVQADFSTAIAAQNNRVAMVGMRKNPIKNSDEAVSFLTIENLSRLTCEESNTNIMFSDDVLPLQPTTYQAYSGISMIDASMTVSDANLEEELVCQTGVSSTEELSQVKFEIRPNPISDILEVVTNSGGSYRIINQNGQIIKAFKEAKKQFMITCHDLPSGIYFLEYTSGIHVEIEKFVVIEH